LGGPEEICNYARPSSEGEISSFSGTTNYLPQLLADKGRIIVLAKKARLLESQQDYEMAFEPWIETSLKIDEFSEKYLYDGNKIHWASKKTFRLLNFDSLRGGVIGLVTGVVSSGLVWWLTK